MKAHDRIRIAFKGLRSPWVLLSAAGFAFAAFCLCFSGAALDSVQSAKSEPCELAVSAPSGKAIADKDMAGILKIPGVKQATGLLPVEVTVKTGQFTAKLTLTGISGACLTGACKLGSVFPESAAMPRIVLNEAACRLFTDDRDDTDDTGEDPSGTAAPLPEINWLKASFTLQAGEGARPIVSAVYGVMPGEKDQAPAAYINLEAAKALVLSSGMKGVKITTVQVHMENIGFSRSVTKALDDLGLTAEDGGTELQAKWDEQTNEAGYLAASGAFGLLFSLALLSAWRRVSRLEEREAWNMLRWMGMRERHIAGVFALQAAMLTITGVAVGITTAALLPSFLPQELKGSSVFMLPLPVWIAAACAILCIASELITFIKEIEVIIGFIKLQIPYLANSYLLPASLLFGPVTAS